MPYRETDPKGIDFSVRYKSGKINGEGNRKIREDTNYHKVVCLTK